MLNRVGAITDGGVEGEQTAMRRFVERFGACPFLGVGDGFGVTIGIEQKMSRAIQCGEIHLAECSALFVAPFVIDIFQKIAFVKRNRFLQFVDRCPLARVVFKRFGIYPN